ncbi:class I SAM-dependent methyltransferase [Bauldia litoralis]|uniref:Phosphatidylethanolamine/phosphatidyl-N-methylethanolamine N-methyltransferase n=1 Tax=Bauldia litoralis TaxID=665467 RepID=A0A1G6ECM9_9HYPH|nr:class I SAM-dependent methyltransferase [Bauldia litoralis]SDB55163.1 phosphatidylethanolamine/phosphatidyl-N-methylethanolamine N-methyltransferase [Bauldia litoralis]
MPGRSFNTGKSNAGQASGATLASLDDSHVVAAYARWAPFYDRFFGAFTASSCRIAVGEINRLPPGRVLELGVGTGISLPLYDRKHRIVGIDLSREMLDIGRKRVADEKLDNVEALVEMDAEALTFEDGGFDAVMAMFVMTVVPDPDRVLAEIVRVVKPGGHVVLVNHFSVEKGPRAWIERWMARYSAKLGWRPTFPIDLVLGRPELKLIRRQSAKSFDLFTMLVFERV